MFSHLGIESKIISDIDEVKNATKIILPGVGSWDNGISRLNESGLMDALKRRVLLDKTPILGICLGMQLLLDTSEEGVLPGLGWIPGHVKKFNFSLEQQKLYKLRVPHMGWNIVKANRTSQLTQNFHDETRFYFVHSYYADVVNQHHALMTCDYGARFTCAVNSEHIWGVQFHPEKSHKFGMALIKRFAEL